MLFHIILLSFGLGGLIFGSNLLLNKSLSFANHFRLSPLIIGSLLLGMGTSTPELFVSGLSAFKEYPNQALGNVIGSNIFNLSIVLGLVYFKFPTLPFLPREMKRDFLYLCLGSIFLFLFLLNSLMSRIEAIFLMLYFLGFLILCAKSISRSEESSPAKSSIKTSNKDLNKEEKPSLQKNNFSVKKNILFILLGFIILFAGGHLSIHGAQKLGHTLGLSERIIGTFILSVGTGLPEFFISFVALFKAQKYNTLALSNIIGSNIFNTGLILGISALILPINIDPHIIRIDIPVLFFFHLSLIVLILFCSLKYLAKILSCFVILPYFFYVIFSLY